MKWLSSLVFVTLLLGVAVGAQKRGDIHVQTSALVNDYRYFPF